MTLVSGYFNLLISAIFPHTLIISQNIFYLNKDIHIANFCIPPPLRVCLNLGSPGVCSSETMLDFPYLK